jgi:tripartite-type tricarboxylate transporter receptor subunit TctC
LLADALAGRLDLVFGTLTTYLPVLRAGRVKAYAGTGETRSALVPEMPTFSEMGLPALSYSDWFALFGPKGTPRDVIAKLNAAAVEALADPAVRSRLTELGYDVFPREKQTPEALASLQKADAQKWWPIIEEFGLKVE